VSSRFSLGPGDYVVIGKLYLTLQGGPTIGVGCELRQGSVVLDFAGAVLVAGRQLPMTLVSTAIVGSSPADFVIACQTDTEDTVATAIAVQLVGISVDQVSGP
jgi:hypothetical protein